MCMQFVKYIKSSFSFICSYYYPFKFFPIHICHQCQATLNKQNDLERRITMIKYKKKLVIQLRKYENFLFFFFDKIISKQREKKMTIIIIEIQNNDLNQ
ncbi:hypothetical protein DERP_005876 [Dermatophagoides pteronyssinus]|uniref:Transmembrane protein n=1 Tax=Dermatophagoides pteronyssinus TaxID=6956 RepID=A0ABQ8JAE1_DERPT|nr:hypothetical protein DERP_005876 [Dermatophagoides pteronyssinus]